MILPMSPLGKCNTMFSSPTFNTEDIAAVKKFKMILLDFHLPTFSFPRPGLDAPYHDLAQPQLAYFALQPF